ncbi:PREDICTED: organic cation/carnitine transporter 5-like [Tarenaya hassleriana]|uniref:organic cation/carnitine transporter 5-like n=1 Tax=Tarenaya hassleriana TaxID=28532 RepID=UPI00053C3A74|nr:PREDICTED: organic cation/carnitine transporter 5-like [Tarenaya hassleriana]
MAGSSPLLSSQLDEETSKLAFDKIVEQSSSGFGFPHLIQAILVGLAMFFVSQLASINIYTDAFPTWHCIDRSICDPATADICELPRSSWDWDGGGGKTVISDFDLECWSSSLRNMPTTAFFVGCVVGGFLLAMIPENLFGRKNLLVFSTSSMSLTNIWIYTSFKFLIGSVRSLLGTYGFMALSGLSQVLQNASWRVFYLSVSISTALYSLILYLFAFEFPRWLNMVGRNEEAMSVLECHIMVSPSSWEIYNYIDETLNGLVELPSFVLAPFLLEKFNRRSSLLANNVIGIVSGVSCSVFGVFGREKAAFAFQLASSFFSRTGINLMTVFVAEMFPTCARNSAAAMAAQAQVIGAILSPIVSPVGRSNLLVSVAIFVTSAFVFSVVVLAMPETKGSNL